MPLQSFDTAMPTPTCGSALRDSHTPGRAPHWAAAQHEAPVDVPSSISRRGSYRHDPYGTRGPAADGFVWSRLTDLRGFRCVSPLHTHNCPSYPLADVSWVRPEHKAAAAERAWDLAPGSVVKLAIGQVPYHLATEQLAHMLACHTEGARLLALEARVQAVPGGPRGSQRRTGLWFVYVHACDALTFLQLDRLVIIRSKDTVLFHPGSEPDLYAWCQAKRAQVMHAAACTPGPVTLPLMAMTVRTT